MKVYRRLEREVKEHTRGKFFTIVIILLFSTAIISYQIGYAKGSIELCIKYGVRYLNSRGFSIEKGAEEINQIIQNYNGHFENWIDNNLTIRPPG